MMTVSNSRKISLSLIADRVSKIERLYKVLWNLNPSVQITDRIDKLLKKIGYLIKDVTNKIAQTGRAALPFHSRLCKVNNNLDRLLRSINRSDLNYQHLHSQNLQHHPQVNRRITPRVDPRIIPRTKNRDSSKFKELEKSLTPKELEKSSLQLSNSIKIRLTTQILSKSLKTPKIYISKLPLNYSYSRLCS